MRISPARLLPAVLALLALAAPARAVTLETPSRVEIGKPFVAEVRSDAAMKNLSVQWLNRSAPLAVERDGNEYVAKLLLGTDVLRAEPGEHRLAVSGEVDGVSTSLVRTVSVLPRDFPEQRLTLPKKMVTPPPKALERIRAERTVIRKALKSATAERFFDLPMVRPVEGSVSSVYGLRRFLNDKPRSPHRGLDLRGAEGSPVRASAAGRVVLVGDHYYAGKSVYIDHGQGVVSHYFHLSEVAVLTGRMVAAGETIGKVGSTGRVTGPHLHFGVSVLYQSVDPMPLFTTMQFK